MGENTQHRDDALLAKYLLGETDVAENVRVQTWLKADSANQEYFEELQITWESTHPFQQKIEVNTDAAWQKVAKKIDGFEKESSEKTVVRKLKSNRNWVWMAAAAVLLLGAFFIFNTQNNPEEIQLASHSEIIDQILPDGSSVALNANSSLSFPDEFSKEKRAVQLKGEAFFDIEKNPKKPFVIEARLGEIKVLGTSFNVEARENENLKVTVVSGKVQLTSANPSRDTSLVILTAGMTGFINQKTGVVSAQNPTAGDALFWFNQKLVFAKTPLSKVFSTLEKNYQIRFSSYDKKLDDCLLTARFEGESLEAILEVVAATFNLEFDVKAEKINIQTDENDCSKI